MSNNSSVLKEFLVKIGFKVDEEKYRNFQEAMRKTAKNAVEMSKTALVATAAMGTALRAAAQQMEGLYFSAKRTGSTVGEMKELAFAASQVGVSAEQMSGALEGLAAARRTNPGLNGILAGLGIDPRQTDNAKVMIELLAKLRSMPYYQGTQIAGLFGINEQSFQMLEKGLPQMQKFMAIREKMFSAAGINPTDQANRSHDFMVQFRTLEAATENLADIIAYRLIPAGEDVIGWLTNLVTWLTKADKATDGWSSKILGVASALAGRSLIKGGLGLIMGRMLGKGAAAETTAGEGATAAGGGLLSVTGGLVAAAMGLALIVFNQGVADKVTSWLGLDPKGQQISNAFKSMFHKTSTFASTSLEAFTAHFEGFRKRVYRDVAGNATVFFGHKLTPGENLSGVNPLSLLGSDLAKAMAAVHRLVKVHLSHNQENALTDFVFNVGAGKFSRSTLLRLLNHGDYAGAANQFQYWNHALVNGHMQVVAGLTARRTAEAALFRGSGGAMTIQQKNEYNIASTDPRGAASEISRKQRRSNGDLVRNFSGAYR